MAFVDVTAIERRDLDYELVWGGHVDLPRPGMTVEGTGVELAGWAIGRQAPARAIVVSDRGVELERTPLNALRPDLAQGFPDIAWAGQGGFRIVVTMPPVAAADLEVHAELADGARVSLGVLSLRRRWRESREEDLRRLVSVVVPCFNQAHFLAEAIESILAQTYPDIEIVVVDDGSTDNTAAVVARFPMVRSVRQENAGAAAARNAGIRASNGDFVTFLDADDLLTPDAVATGVEALRAHPAAAFVFGYAEMFMEDGTEAPVPHCPTFADDYYARLLAGCPIMSIASVMHRRAVFQAVGTFDPGLRYLEDYDLYYRVARQFPIHCHGRMVTKYRRHGTNATSTGGRVPLRTVRAVLDRQREFARESPVLWDAYLRGRRYWAGGMGLALAREVQDDLAQGRWRSASLGIATMLRWWPPSIVNVARSPRRMTPFPEWRPEG